MTLNQLKIANQMTDAQFADWNNARIALNKAAKARKDAARTAKVRGTTIKRERVVSEYKAVLKNDWAIKSELDLVIKSKIEKMEEAKKPYSTTSDDRYRAVRSALNEYRYEKNPISPEAAAYWMEATKGDNS